MIALLPVSRHQTPGVTANTGVAGNQPRRHRSGWNGGTGSLDRAIFSDLFAQCASTPLVLLPRTANLRLMIEVVS